VLASGRTARADIHAISIVPAEARTIVARYDHTHYARVATYREDESETRAYRNRGAIDELSG